MKLNNNTLLVRILIGFIAGSLLAGLFDIGFFWSIGCGIIGAILSRRFWK